MMFIKDTVEEKINAETKVPLEIFKDNKEAITSRKKIIVPSITKCCSNFSTQSFKSGKFATLHTFLIFKLHNYNLNIQSNL